MGDVLSAAQRSYCMSRIKGRNTIPEVVLRKALWRLGFRYSLRSKLPGKPDLIFPAHKIALFVDGCFWHKCPKHYVRPTTNAKFWATKIQANVRRDRHVTHNLRRLGWSVIRIWEHQLATDVDQLAISVASKIRRGSSFLK
jgi:DNA mismatch endonuclease (patch repair protein)